MSWSYLPELEEVFSGKTFSAMLQLEPLAMDKYLQWMHSPGGF